MPRTVLPTTPTMSMTPSAWDLLPSQTFKRSPFGRKRSRTSGAASRNPAPLQFQPTAIRALIDRQVSDLLENTRRCLKEHAIGTLADVRTAAKILVGPGDEVRG